MKTVGKAIRKKDAMSLVTGKPVYTDDIAPDGCLIVKVLRSPHAHAMVKHVDTARASKVPGIACIITPDDCPQTRFTMAGQTYPELSPYDRLILDRHIRFAGDAVVIVAGETDTCVDQALKMLKVEYELLEPVLDFRKAKDHPSVIHPEDDWKALVPVGEDHKRNLVCSGVTEEGAFEDTLEKCEYIVEETYHTKAYQQAMMETFRTFTKLDAYGRLEVVSSTQVPFHVRRILSTALEIPKSKVRVIKPRIGGGFGAKQTLVAEIFPALVTWKTGKPAKMIFTRKESQIASSPRHEMEVTVRVGADRDGTIRALGVHTLSNAGAFGDHTPTTIGLTGSKTLPLYTTNVDAFRFSYEGVYTNHMPAGAYRGYGATQGIFAVESALNELAVKIGMDPTELKEKNLLKQGDYMRAYEGGYHNAACTIDKCLERAKELIGWEEKYPCRTMPDGKIRSVGLAASMQGSGIAHVDVGEVTIKVGDDGIYNLMIGATDMGTGCDTILAQMAAECLDTDVDNISVHGVDTDVSPYDGGSYASSTTYITGMAVVKACEKLRDRILEAAAAKLEEPSESLEFDGTKIYSVNGEKEISFLDLANNAMLGNSEPLAATAGNSSPFSPPPYMVGAVETEIDPDTGEIKILDYVGVIDCGTVINPALARVQAEGGIVQGIGMALYEDVVYSQTGTCYSNSFMQYKIPSRLDVGEIRIEFEPSYEPTGPFGAKSIGELVINTPAPALAHAVYNATGLRIRELPLSAEKIAMGLAGYED